MSFGLISKLMLISPMVTVKSRTIPESTIFLHALSAIFFEKQGLTLSKLECFLIVTYRPEGK
tara:strand:+ start:2175 stop:2360 length:186 start_codon:yes stop_codon:yes gene_type:complete